MKQKLLCGLLLVISGVAWAEPPPVATTQAQPLSAELAEDIAGKFEQRFPGIKVDEVNSTPMAGIYEVQIGFDLVYTDVGVDYVMQGALIDARQQHNLTAERMRVLEQVDFASLPLEHAIKQVKGSGARQVAVFEDPNCGYCKQLHASLEHIDDTTVYTFLYPILSPESAVKARNIWCADDPAQVWKGWMVQGQLPAEAKCDNPIQDNLELGRKLNVQGTPALFFADGTRANGALPLEALQARFDALL